VSAWADGLRAELHREGILVNRVEPGFVSTPMVSSSTKDAFLEVNPKDAARVIQSGLANDLPLVAFPSSMFALGSVFHGLADGVRDTIARSGFLRVIGYKPSGKGKGKGKGGGGGAGGAREKKAE